MSRVCMYYVCNGVRVFVFNLMYTVQCYAIVCLYLCYKHVHMYSVYAKVYVYVYVCVCTVCMCNVCVYVHM